MRRSLRRHSHSVGFSALQGLRVRLGKHVCTGAVTSKPPSWADSSSRRRRRLVACCVSGLQNPRRQPSETIRRLAGKLRGKFQVIRVASATGFSLSCFAILGNLMTNTFIIEVLSPNVSESFNHSDKLFPRGSSPRTCPPGWDEDDNRSALSPVLVTAKLSFSTQRPLGLACLFVSN